MGGMSAGVDAVEDLREALAAAGLLTESPAASDAQADLWLDTGAALIPLQVKATGLATASNVGPLLQQPNRFAGVTVVVADRVVAPARELLSRPGWGWLDRRGRLALRAPGVVIDTPVPATYQPRLSDPLDTNVGREVACALLLDEPMGSGRALARQLNRSPGAVATALATLRTAGLIDEAGAAVVPALFWAVADRWPRGAVPLRRPPQPGYGRDNAALEIGFDGVESSVGWAVTDSLAAAAYGAPIAIASAYPPDFLVPTLRHVTRAERLLGGAADADRGATVRLAPVPWACVRRVDAAERGIANTEWPLAHPLFVALDLASDPGRGREILDDWTPPHPWRRVW